MAHAEQMLPVPANPPVSFNKFIEMMSQEQAKDLVRKINTFMKEFRQKVPEPETDSAYVQDFIIQMENAIARHPLWSQASPAELEASMEALEKYLLTKLFDRTFGVSGVDRERDQVLSTRLAALQFICPEHLEMSPQTVGDGALVHTACKELNKINMFKAPRDKLVCILSCCGVINNLLAVNAKTEGIGADDFTPTLIYVVIRAQTPSLASNLSFIERYRMRSKLTSEAQYYFTQLSSAAIFIETMDASSLKVDPDEFIAHMLAHGAIAEEELSMMQHSSSSGGSKDRSVPTLGVAQGVAVTQGPQQKYSAQGALQMQPLPANQSSVVVNPIFSHGQGAQPQDVQMGYPQPSYGTPNTASAYPVLSQPAPGTSQPASAVAGSISAGRVLGFPAQDQQGQQSLLSSRSSGSTEQTLPSVHGMPSLEALEAQGMKLLVEIEATGKLREKYKYLYTPTDSLTIGDIQDLLQQYKEMVLRYEMLTLGLQQQSMVQSGVRQVGSTGAAQDTNTPQMGTSQSHEAAAGKQYGGAPLDLPTRDQGLSGGSTTDETSVERNSRAVVDQRWSEGDLPPALSPVVVDPSPTPDMLGDLLGEELPPRTSTDTSAILGEPSTRSIPGESEGEEPSALASTGRGMADEADALEPAAIVMLSETLEVPPEADPPQGSHATLRQVPPGAEDPPQGALIASGDTENVKEEDEEERNASDGASGD